MRETPPRRPPARAPQPNGASRPPRREHEAADPVRPVPAPSRSDARTTPESARPTPPARRRSPDADHESAQAASPSASPSLTPLVVARHPGKKRHRPRHMRTGVTLAILLVAQKPDVPRSRKIRRARSPRNIRELSLDRVPRERLGRNRRGGGAPRGRIVLEKFTE